MKNSRHPMDEQQALQDMWMSLGLSVGPITCSSAGGH